MNRINTFKKWKEAAIEQNFKCAYCGCDFLSDPYKYASAEVEHFIPLSKGGSEVYIACSFCNKLKRDRIFNTMEEAIRELDKLREEYLRRYEFEELKSKHRK